MRAAGYCFMELSLEGERRYEDKKKQISRFVRDDKRWAKGCSTGVEAPVLWYSCKG